MYKRIVVESQTDFMDMLNFVRANNSWISFDTETTGLHIKKDTPFLLTLSLEDRSYAVEIDKFSTSDLQTLFDSLTNYTFVIGQNVKYDLHMMKNIGVNYTTSNLTDVMIMARLALDADDTLSLQLKYLAKKYLYTEAGDDEKIIKSYLTALRREQTAVLKQLLKNHGKTKAWFDTLKKDVIFELSDLGHFEEPYRTYLAENPEPNYLDVFKMYRSEMMSYAMNDTEIALDLAKKFYPSVLAKQQEEIFKLENSIILPLFRMERVGLQIDREYIERSRVLTKTYIEELRNRMTAISGVDFKIGQHKFIKELFLTKWGIELLSTDDHALESVEKGNDDEEAKQLAALIRELRTLEKWYSTYILGMLEKSEYDGRAYTQINQASAVTGRVSSDFQQFPKYGMSSKDGVELFHPRRAVVTTGNGYDSLYYLDYSQIELRVQANYTYVISGGDLNMCRAYMPFQCHLSTGKKFDPKEDHDLVFKEQWFHDEDNAVWKPVDLHAATAMKAFPDANPSDPSFKVLRSLGKSTNFAKNYGATTKALIDQFGFEKSVAEALNAGYYEAFPKILDYQKLVSTTFRRRGFVKNWYGRRYYIQDSRFVYKLYNYIIQGTCADMLKRTIAKVDKLLLPYKSRFQMNIHDELSFEIYKGEEFLIPAIKKIMEDIDWMSVPVVADVEISHTNWAEKEDYEIQSL